MIRVLILLCLLATNVFAGEFDYFKVEGSPQDQYGHVYGKLTYCTYNCATVYSGNFPMRTVFGYISSSANSKEEIPVVGIEIDNNVYRVVDKQFVYILKSGGIY